MTTLTLSTLETRLITANTLEQVEAMLTASEERGRAAAGGGGPRAHGIRSSESGKKIASGHAIGTMGRVE